MFQQRAASWLTGGGIAAVLFFATPLAQAQSPFPNGSKGYQQVVQQQQYLQRRAQAARPATVRTPPPPAATLAPAPAPLTVAVTAPESRQFAIDIRGPEGETRTFQVTGGPQAIQVRRYVLQPGEQLTIRLPAADQR